MMYFLLIAFAVMAFLFLKQNASPLIIPPNSFIVDVRTPREFKGGSAPGAVNIPLNQVSNSIDQFKGKESIVVFCMSGARSGKAKTILENNGIKNVLNGISKSKVTKNL